MLSRKLGRVKPLKAPLGRLGRSAIPSPTAQRFVTLKAAVPDIAPDSGAIPEDFEMYP
jgi:hypothetical protein